uniref:Uncharacterized protein n=1 Tax=Romanomermis culicivorax TaxID=13658 RepID=A0A915IWM0_ROMCU
MVKVVEISGTVQKSSKSCKSVEPAKKLGRFILYRQASKILFSSDVKLCLYIWRVTMQPTMTAAKVTQKKHSNHQTYQSTSNYSC